MVGYRSYSWVCGLRRRFRYRFLRWLPPPAHEFTPLDYVSADNVLDARRLKSAAPVSLDQAPPGVRTGVDPGRKSVLVYLKPELARNCAERVAVKAFTVKRGGHVKYEYTTAMPNVLNLRNITPADIENLKRMPGVLRVEEDLYHHYVLNLDEATPLVRGLQSQITGAGLSADGTGIRVCVCDTGIDMDHIMYTSRIDTVASFDFVNNDGNPDDDNGHGSHVAGIAVGGTGITVDLGCDGVEPFQGAAPNATLIGAKILNAAGGGTDSDIIAGIDHCADQTPSGGRADVINLSIGTGNFVGNCTHSWAVACNNAVANGVVVVAASGNENNSNSMGSPACGVGVIAVGATYKAAYPNCEDATSTFNWIVCTDNSPAVDQIVCFSNEADGVDVAAPGSVILSASNAAGGTSTTNKSGTSMASPMVAGLAALVLDLDPTLTPAEVRQFLRDGATDMGPVGFDRAYGFGRVDFVNTLSLVTPCTTNADCDDLDPCTTDVCTAGSCSNTPMSCPPGQVCNAGVCEGQGACCNGTNCSIDSPANCSGASGIYLGDGSVCGSGKAGNPTIYQSTPNIAIPDGGGSGNAATDIINVPDSVIVGDVDIDLTVTHTWVGDLTVRLSHGGTTVTVLDRPGVPASTFGCSNDNFSGILLDDEGTGGTIESQCALNLTSPPNYVPNNALSAFDGMDSAGAWTITVYDSATPDPGTLNTWSVHIDALGSNPCTAICTTNGDCDNAVFCDGAEICDGMGVCQSGTPPTINDGIACTDDSCDEVNDVIVNTPNNANCDDALFCNGAETCSATLDCQAGTPPTIDDGIACTDDSCEEVNDVVVNAPNNANCDDALFCNGAETCSATLDCQAGTAPCVDVCEHCVDTTDTCDWCIFDLDLSGVTGTGDFSLFSPCFGNCYLAGDPCLVSNFDADPNGCVGTGDYAPFVGCFGNACGACGTCSGPGAMNAMAPTGARRSAAALTLIARPEQSINGFADVLPKSMNSWRADRPFYLEVWISQNAAADSGVGLAAAYANVQLDPDALVVENVAIGSAFPTLAQAVTSPEATASTLVGGCAVPGDGNVGVASKWVLVAALRVHSVVDGAVSATLAPAAKPYGVSNFNVFGNVDPSRIEFGQVSVDIYQTGDSRQAVRQKTP